MNIFDKKIMYKIHTYISLIFCIPLVIVCFTGSVLVYKDEINNILMRERKVIVWDLLKH